MFELISETLLNPNLTEETHLMNLIRMVFLFQFFMILFFFSFFYCEKKKKKKKNFRSLQIFLENLLELVISLQ